MGADDNILSNKFLPFGKARMGYPTGEARWGLIFNTVTDYRFILVYRSSRCQGAAKLHRNVGCGIPVESLLS